MNNSRIVALLEDILIWTKVGMYSSVKAIILDEFEEARSEKKLAYQLLDGTNTQKEIVEYCKKELGNEIQISNASLSGWVDSWEKIGLLKKNGRQVVKNFSLTDFGFTDNYLKV